MKTIELFAGGGGLGIGLFRAGFHPVKVIEWDKYCCDTIRENKRRCIASVKDWDLFEGDVRTVNFSDYEGKIHLVSGGPPCQPFSLGGKHRAHLDSRDMFPQAIRAVREIKPQAFIFENVKGLTRSAFRNYFEYIKLQLTHPELVIHPDETWLQHLARLEKAHTSGNETALKYNVVTRILNAADYGVPQRRERVFFVGFRCDIRMKWSFPEPTHSQESLLWDQYRSSDYWERHGIARKQHSMSEPCPSRVNAISERPRLKPWRTVRDAIHDLPDPQLDLEPKKFFFNHVYQAGAKSYPGHTGSRLDEPAKTLKAGDHGVPGGENMLCRNNGSVRYFTVRESARLQTFPDNYVFHGSWTETMRQLGNAVPVLLANTVGSSVFKHLQAIQEGHFQDDFRLY
ncbi:MAG TPA: DNA cytosine methyltransferase [Verrucomicrobiae bacterium]|jgi:DNA (cytosine-5)-methyltransferase 1|nr:DNA cytosine methyltransferase [Verrucomicrobiae bacterium]